MKTDSGTLIETDINNINTYEVTTTSAKTLVTNQVVASFELYSNDVVSAFSFTNFSMIGDVNTINTSIQVVGASSGASIIIPVVIKKSTTT